MKYKILLILTMLIIFFQNFSLVNILDKKYFIDEAARKNHAQEILGTKYNKSLASQFEGERFMHVYIFNIVQEALPAKYKKKANLISKAIITEAKKHELDPLFLISIIFTESSFNPEARGSSGEIGLMQLMPNTGKEVAQKFKIPWSGVKTLKNPINNIRVGAAYLNQLRDFFNKKPHRYITAYNSGPGKIRKIENLKDLPKFYSTKILKHYEQFYELMIASKIPKNLAIN